MFTNHTNPTRTNDEHACTNWRAVGDLAGDLISVISIFATGYIRLLIGHGLGLN